MYHRLLDLNKEVAAHGLQTRSKPDLHVQQDYSGNGKLRSAVCACVCLSVHLFSAGSNYAELGNVADHGWTFRNRSAVGCPWPRARRAPPFMGRAKAGMSPAAPVTQYFTAGVAVRRL